MIKYRIIASLILAMASPALAEVEQHPLISDKFSLQAGSFFASTQLKIRVDGSVVVQDAEFGRDLLLAILLLAGEFRHC